jgi:hypothetical protein
MILEFFIGGNMKHIFSILLLTAFVFNSITNAYAANPIIKDYFTADPAALVHDGKVYLYTGHDQAQTNGDFFVLKEWNIFSSTDLKNWELEGSLPRTAFTWAKNDSAWASQAIEKDGKFYWYVTVLNNDPNDRGYAIGVAVSGHPVDGFVDAIGGPLVSNSMTESPEFMGTEAWDDIDPTVFIDDDGQAYLYWGNTHLYYAKLNDNMIELDGEIQRVEIDNMRGTFTEAPWLHKNNGKYYLSFARDYPEKLAYAMSEHPEGPWEYKGLLMDLIPGSGTSHQAFLEFEGESYFIYHTAALPTGGNYRRSVSMEKLMYNADGMIEEIIPTASGATEDSHLLQTFSHENSFVKRIIGAVRIAQAGGNPLDSKWYIAEGLAGEGEGYISFQAENNPGYYLKSDGSKIVLSKNDGTEAFKEKATFKITKGLADKNWSSFQSYSNESFYLHQESTKTLSLSEIDSEIEKKNATFRIIDDEGEVAVIAKANESLNQDKYLSLFIYIFIGLCSIILIGKFGFKNRRERNT